MCHRLSSNMTFFCHLSWLVTHMQPYSKGMDRGSKARTSCCNMESPQKVKDKADNHKEGVPSRVPVVCLLRKKSATPSADVQAR